MKLENYFVDGTKIEADANKHKVVWAKRKDRYQKRVKEQIGELLKQIDQANDEEEAEYGERGSGRNGREWFRRDVKAKKLKQKIAELNERLKKSVQKSGTEEKGKAARQALKKLETDCLPRLEKYEQQTSTLAGRNSYSKTDPDATCMR